VNDIQVGRVFRAMRIRRGWRQVDVARKAGVHRDAVSLLENGRVEALSVTMLRRLWSSIGVALDVDPRIPTAERARLLDASHAELVERVARAYRASGWQTLVEFTFNDYGERGAVDLLAWNEPAAALAINEAKTRLPDIQELHATFDRKVRIVPAAIAKARGWRARVVGRLLVVADTTSNRDAVAAHAATFEASFPGRSVAARRWIESPSGGLAAIWFLRNAADNRRSEVRRRVAVAPRA
jgi:transcriptional regulator with XRE-family HTH domain